MAKTTAHTGDAVRLKQRLRSELRWLRARILGHAAVMLIAAASIPQLSESEAFGGFSWQVVSFFLVGVLLLTASLTFL